MKRFGFLALAAVGIIFYHPDNTGQHKDNNYYLSLKKDNSFSLSPIETQVMGQNTWLTGSRSALRVIVSDHDSGKPLNANVRISLASKGADGSLAPATLYNGNTDKFGTLDSSFRVPKLNPGSYQLIVDVKASEGTDKVTEDIQLKDGEKALLTSDKPIYQPGQTIHMRALVMNMGDLKPASGTPATFEVEDGRGNRVFKETLPLSEFGTAGADFALADELNMGAYRLSLILPQTQVEKTVQVEQYVLPKFKIRIKPDKDYYLPGQLLTCEIRSLYFFGKPVAHASVSVELNTEDVGVHNLETITGKTDDVGSFTFRYKLPGSFAGQPVSQGNASLGVDVTIKDTADHIQLASLILPVALHPALLLMVPEHSGLIAGIPNRFYIAATTPDGRPLSDIPLKIRLTTASSPAHETDIQAHTNATGLSMFDFTPKAVESYSCNVEAKTAAGSTDLQQSLSPGSPSYNLILRADKPLAKVGERLNLTALCGVPGGTVYLDVIRYNQTILTSVSSIHNGIAKWSLPLTQDMEGTLELHAYRILPNEDIIRDTRLVVVSPAQQLRIGVVADKETYRPGQDARFHITVRTGDGAPVAAALGISMVDESVFSLAEQEPGLAQVYFTLEKELMTPRFEIHGLDPILQTVKGGIFHPVPSQQMAANLLFSALNAQQAAAQIPNGMMDRGFPQNGMRLRRFPQVAQNGMQNNMQETSGIFGFKVDTYTNRWMAIRDRVMKRMMNAAKQIDAALNQYYKIHGHHFPKNGSVSTLAADGLLLSSALMDPWGHPYSVNLSQAQIPNDVSLSSGGPDGKWKTSDDIDNVYEWGENVPERFLFAGDGGGFAGNGRIALERAAPMAFLKNEHIYTGVVSSGGATSNSSSAVQSPHVRSYFPETLYWNPELLTNSSGDASLDVPMADSITNWRMSLLADSLNGDMGSVTKRIRVFQPFFVDIDLPVALTQGDQVQIPVSIYNYLSEPQKVKITLKPDTWYSLEGSSERTITVQPEQVSVIYYPLKAASFGNRSLTVTAIGTRFSDAVKRSVMIKPDGQEHEIVFNGTLEGTVNQNAAIPEGAIPGASSLLIKIYPGVFSQIVEGLDGILQMPYGCFEQTSSTTYPDILVLSYLKQNRKADPQLQMKAEQYINVGYQRLVSFEVPSGGFSWFGNAPANQVLTSYGLLEFHDMSKVRDVDQNLIIRTQNWLAGKQQADGSWSDNGPGIAEGIINRQTGALRTTAYVTWALSESGYRGPALKRGADYVAAHLNQADDPYTLAVILNMFVNTDPKGAQASQIANKLIGLAHTTDKTAWWQGHTMTFTGARSEGADLETCGLASYGLARWGGSPGFTTKALSYLVEKRDSQGAWETTQATVWAMRALLYASSQGLGGGTGTVTALADGKIAHTIQITQDNRDLMRLLPLKGLAHSGANMISLRYEGKGALLYQIAGTYYMPWSRSVPPIAAQEPPLSLKVNYDRTTLSESETARVEVVIHNNTQQKVEMPLIDVGVPPGFDVDSAALDAAVKKNVISKFTVAARQIIIYLQSLSPGQTVTVRYNVKARFPVRAQTPSSTAYPYYNPKQIATVLPETIIVRK